MTLPDSASASNIEPVIKTPQELVHIKHKITILQYKYWVLMLRAYREAYEGNEQDFLSTDYCYIPMSRLSENLGYEPKTSDIRNDLEAIRKEPIIFNFLEKDGKKGQTGRGFISEWSVSANRVGVTFPRIIREAIENLDSRDSIFHLLNWSVFNSFTGKYEAVIYKLCKDYVGVGRTPYMSLEKFRGYMGIKDNEYPDFKRLNQWVISGPIKKINESELSDITVSAEFKRESRKIVGIWFVVRSKKQTVMDFGDDPAFRLAKVSVALAQQKEYLAKKAPELIELSIQRANEYGEEQEKNGKTVNFGALYRKAIDEDWGKEYQSKQLREADKQAKKVEVKTAEAKSAEQKQLNERKAAFIRMETSRALKELTKEQINTYAVAYREQLGEAGKELRYDTEKAEFVEIIKHTQFTIWLRKVVAPVFNEKTFGQWSSQGK